MSALGTELVRAIRLDPKKASHAYVAGYLEGMVSDLARLPGASGLIQYNIDRLRADAEAAAQPNANKEA